MEKKYKAISTIVTQKPGTKYDSETREKRYVIIDTESGEIVDDAQGYGYKTAQKAYAGWSYKNRDKSKDKEKAEKERIIARWLRENKKFVRLLDSVAFDIQTRQWEYEDKVDAKLVRSLLKENGFTNLPFSAGDLLRYWDKGPMYSRKKSK